MSVYIDSGRFHFSVTQAFQRLRETDPDRATQVASAILEKTAPSEADFAAVCEQGAAHWRKLTSSTKRLTAVLELLGLDARSAGVRLLQKNAPDRATRPNTTRSDSEPNPVTALFPLPREADPSAIRAKVARAVKPVSPRELFAFLAKFSESATPVALFRNNGASYPILAIDANAEQRLRKILSRCEIFESEASRKQFLAEGREKGVYAGDYSDATASVSFYFVVIGSPHWNKLHSDLLAERTQLSAPGAGTAYADRVCLANVPIDVAAAARHNTLTIPDVLDWLSEEPQFLAEFHLTEIRGMLDFALDNCPEAFALFADRVMARPVFYFFLMRSDGPARRAFLRHLAEVKPDALETYFQSLPSLDNILALADYEEDMTDAPPSLLRAHLAADDDAERAMAGQEVTIEQLRAFRDECAAMAEGLREDQRESGLPDVQRSRERLIYHDFAAILDAWLAGESVDPAHLKSRLPLRKLERQLREEGAQFVRSVHRQEWWETHGAALIADIVREFAQIRSPA